MRSWKNIESAPLARGQKHALSNFSHFGFQVGAKSDEMESRWRRWLGFFGAVPPIVIPGNSERSIKSRIIIKNQSLNYIVILDSFCLVIIDKKRVVAV